MCCAGGSRILVNSNEFNCFTTRQRHGNCRVSVHLLVVKCVRESTPRKGESYHQYLSGDAFAVGTASYGHLWDATYAVGDASYEFGTLHMSTKP